jgi:integrase
MAGQVFKMCTKCPKRARYRDKDRRCPKCGASTYTWYFSVDVGTDAATGKRKRKKVGGFSTKREAEKAMAEVVSKVHQNRYVESSKLSVHEFLVGEWLPTMEMAIEGSTWTGYKEYIHRYVLDRIGDVPLRDLKAQKLNWLYSDVRKNGRSRGTGPLSLKTVREVHVIMHRALEDAVRWEYIEVNPADRATPPSSTAAKNSRKESIRTWSAEEVHEFAQFAEDHPFYALWLLTASTGMRRSELLGLRWKDVDLDRGLVAIRQVLVKVGGRGRFKPAPKSRHGFRTLRIPARLVEALARLRDNQEKPRADAEEWNDLDLVFCRPDGLPWHPDYVTSAVRKLIEASGLPRIRPLQDLRHTHATLLLVGGEHLKVVQERLGHHSHSFTSDTYQHVTPGMDDAAAARFDGMVFGPKGDDEDDEAGSGS